MDTAVLVATGEKLLSLMAADNFEPRLMAWMNESEANRWRLWIVPSAPVPDKPTFYRRVSAIISANRAMLQNLEISDIEFVEEKNPVVQALRVIARVERGGQLHMSGTRLNGYFVPDAVILRQTL